MLRPTKVKVSLAVGSIAVLAVAGGLLGRRFWPGPFPFHIPSGSLLSRFNPDSQLSPVLLSTLSSSELTEIARDSSSPRDRNRARYLLAQALLTERPSAALEWLNGLEQDYPVLGPHILSLRAQIYSKLGNTTTATETWQQLLDTYGNSPVAAEALSALAQTEEEYGDRLLQDWPAHPLAVELAIQRLKEDPENLDLLRIVVRHGLYTYTLRDSIDRLTDTHADVLSPEDWAAIGFAHWEKLNYPQAAKAYAKAEPTPLHLYRAARSFQIADQPESAIAYYRRLATAFPEAPETAQGLSKLAPLLAERDPQAALTHWDHLYRIFPDYAAEALVGKAETLALVGSEVSAIQARQSVLSQYSDSDAAAALRWQQAQDQAAAGNLEEAATLAHQIQRLNPHSSLTAEAGFWAGRWWQDGGQARKAENAWKQVLRDQPDDYFAWRSAVFLNLPVGDFSTVWQQAPQVQVPPNRPPLTAGSETLKELFLLGEYGDAWRLWQVEFTDPVQPSVAEQFTDGVIRMSIGDYLDGIFMLNSLHWNRSSAEQAQVAELRQQGTYWQSLYPFPFTDIITTWSAQRQVNPILVTALMRQESRFMPGIESFAGAVGLMQVMPSTGDWIAEQIDLGDYDLWDPDTNVSLGTWYLNYTHEEWDGNSMLAIASYNAGPGNVAEWLDRYGLTDTDRFVEQIPFAETQGYVESVFGNYWNYLRLYNPSISAMMAQYSPEHAKIAFQTPSE
ncbi:MAG: transglycosylase SLT domain-containing protein [Prochlorothrix sp.]|nr:transglycosylase SLT domain-containing protein [Prochlorothrix sp.]